MPNVPRYYNIKILESKILKIEMFEFQCVNIESWKLKFEIYMWNEFEILKIKMFELGCVNT